ncbi:MAG: class I SAM-dependent methyltransferase [bacterium]|nr:class I SAM-dependent methyltransferase [bacterium]
MSIKKPSFHNESSSEQPQLPTQEELKPQRMERGRNLEEYLSSLSLTIGDLRDKVILDVGSGKGRFTEQLREEGIETAYSVDPFIEPGEHKSSQGVVQGFAETLPFRDETFDLEVALYSVPYYSKTKEQVCAAFHQILRALKPGGEIRIFPLISYLIRPKRLRSGRMLLVGLKTISVNMKATHFVSYLNFKKHLKKCGKKIPLCNSVLTPCQNPHPRCVDEWVH